MSVKRIPSRLLRKPCPPRAFSRKSAGLRFAAIACVLAMGVGLLGSCASTSLPQTSPTLTTTDSPDPKVEILGLLSQVEQAMERGEVNAILAAHHPDYRDDEGRDLSAIRAHLASLFRQYNGIRIERNPIEVQIFGTQARVTESVHTRASRASGESVEWRGINHIRLQQRQGTWLITAWGSWEPSRT